MTKPIVRKQLCAIYTRKSSEERLEQEFNSLHTQREAFIASQRRLFHPTGGATRVVQAQPDWPTIHRKLRRTGVTLSLLWEEYRAAHPEG